MSRHLMGIWTVSGCLDGVCTVMGIQTVSRDSLDSVCVSRGCLDIVWKVS